MASIPQLREDLESLERAIERQKEVLKDLEKQRSDVQSELNSLIDPIARLPPEISSDILLKSLPMPPLWSSLLLLRLVCRAWSTLALATPSLWSTITDEGMPGSNFVGVVERWLGRAPGLPISLILRDTSSAMLAVYKFEALEAYAPQIQTLHDGSIDVIARFNTLRFLTIQYAVPLSPSLLLALLRGLPNLIKLEMYNVIYSPMLAMTRHFTHRNLECLHFGYLEGFIRFSDTSILPLLTLPALQSLLISRDRISETDLHHFLVRSSPPLRYLGIQFREQDLRSPTTIACLGLIPTLTDLQILRPHSWSGVVQALSLFELWATAPDLLPALENLSIEADAEPGTDVRKTLLYLYPADRYL